MDVVVPNYWKNIVESYGIPIYSAHRVDLHNQLKTLATQVDGLGDPVNIQIRADVVEYVSEGGTIAS